MLRTALIATVIAFLSVYALGLFLRRTSMFYPSRHPSGTWSVDHLPVRPSDHEFETEDGVRLHGWFFRAEASHAPVLIWFHGNAGNITDRAPVAAELATRGVSVFLFDWRGFGRSRGTPTESGLLRDAVAAYDYAVAALGADPARVVLYGESIGGPFAAHVATRRKACCAVLENSFPSLRELANAIYAPLPMGWLAPFALDTTRWLNSAGVPVLIMHGRRDSIIPVALALSMYEELRVPKRLFISERADHAGIPSAEGERYYRELLSFIDARR